MGSRGRTWWVVGAVVVIAAVIVGFLLSRGCTGAGGAGSEAGLTTPTAVPSPTPEETPGVGALPEGVTLNTSDVAVRQLVAGLSQNPKLVAWLAHEDLVRRFVASVYNIAHGKSPRTHLAFMRPQSPFKVENKNGELITDPRSYRRYNLAAGVFSSIDTQGAVQVLQELRPLTDQAFGEIARPGETFQQTLYDAIAELLRTPEVPPDAPLEEKVITYRYADPKLEALSDAQRHLLRMGPDNVRRVKTKLRELAVALGMPASQIPGE
ncbi:MAG: DUF3014 domain-containing protein [Acidobacteria bacterium]|nr:DUF3014 domain-containing protein [Acidobacteriota bacterium]